MTARHLHLVTTPTTDEVIAARTAELVAQIKAEKGPAYTHALMSYELIPCPLCKQPAGMYCKTSGGWQKIGVHAGRRNAIARMTADERIAAYAERKAWEEHLQASNREHFSKPLPPEIAAAREASRQAGLRVEAEVREAYARCSRPWAHSKDCTCRTDQEDR